MTGKHRVVLDGNSLAQVSKSIGSMFQYPFQIKKHFLNIIQEQHNYALKIENQDFQQLYMFQQMSQDQEEENQEEEEEEEEVREKVQKSKKQPTTQTNKQDVLNDWYSRNRGVTTFDTNIIREEQQEAFEPARAKSNTISKQQQVQQPTTNQKDLFADRQDFLQYTFQEQQQPVQAPQYQTAPKVQQQQTLLVQPGEQKQKPDLSNDLLGLFNTPSQPSYNQQQQFQQNFTQPPQNQTYNTNQSYTNPTMQNQYSSQMPQYQQSQPQQQIPQNMSLKSQSNYNEILDFTSPQESSAKPQQPVQQKTVQQPSQDFDIFQQSTSQPQNQQQNLFEPQKPKEDKTKEISLLCNLDNLDSDNERQANLKKQQQQGKLIPSVPGSVPMKQLQNQTQSNPGFNMQNMPQMNNMQQQMQFMSQMNQMNQMNQANQMNQMMQMFSTMMNQGQMGQQNFQANNSYMGGGPNYKFQ